MGREGGGRKSLQGGGRGGGSDEFNGNQVTRLPERLVRTEYKNMEFPNITLFKIFQYSHRNDGTLINNPLILQNIPLLSQINQFITHIDHVGNDTIVSINSINLDKNALVQLRNLHAAIVTKKEVLEELDWAKKCENASKKNKYPQYKMDMVEQFVNLITNATEYQQITTYKIPVYALKTIIGERWLDDGIINTFMELVNLQFHHVNSLYANLSTDRDWAELTTSNDIIIAYNCGIKMMIKVPHF